MPVEIPKESYTGKIGEVTLGTDKPVKVGGETSLPFYLFEGESPNLPKIAMEVNDIPPDEWPESLAEYFKDVGNDPVAWAQKCEKEYQVDLICLRLIGTDPNGLNRSADEAAEIAKKVVDAVSIPVIIYGCENLEKDAEVLKKIAEVCEGKNILLGPAQQDNYKSVVAPSLGYKQKVISQTPIDINLAKQLNILVENLGMTLENVVMDPTTGCLGYGLEYVYTVIERDKIAALMQNDDKLQVPIINNLGKEAWKVKESRVSGEEAEGLGNVKTRGILWEAITATALILTGSDILVVRHPETVKLIRQIIKELSEG